MSSIVCDIVVGVQYGDEAKGKITHHLAREGNYTHVVRYNGGHNAGHTIYHEGKKFITHVIPCGVFFGIESVIGPGCVINPQRLLEEMAELRDAGIDIDNLLSIAKNAHVITDFHLAEDNKDKAIGTTKRGNGPAYRDKYGRKGVRAEQVPELAEYLIDVYQEFHHNGEHEQVEILFEGAQGFGLDVDWGDYPYVTSSHCTVGGAVLNGVPAHSIRKVYGAAKIYETYVGAKEFGMTEGIEAKVIREFGEEFGATTGRPRKIDWFDVDSISKAIDINGLTTLVINKVDVLERVGKFILYHGDDKFEFDSMPDMQHYIKEHLKREGMDIIFSGHKDKI
jgi:adenylosuccinate synthase